MSGLRDRLRAQREAQLAPKRKTLQLPGWDGDVKVYVRYRPVEWETLTALLAAQGIDAKAALESNCDALVAACDALLVREDGDAEPVSLAEKLRQQGEDVPQREVRFDTAAVDVLGLTFKGEGDIEPRAPTTPRETVRAAFAGCVVPELAIAEQAAVLGEWMRSTGQEVDESLVGESNASPKLS